MPRAKKKFSYDFPRPAVTVDIVVITRESRPRILLIQRAKDPFASMWALPGGFIDEKESIVAAAHRELREETGMESLRLEPLHAFGDPGRDPRGWTISIAFLTQIEATSALARAGDDASATQWFPIDSLPPLAFDHQNIIDRALTRIADRAP